MSGHGAGDDWGYHEGSHVDDPVERIPVASVMQKEDVCNHGWLDGFCWTGSDTVESADVRDDRCEGENILTHMRP